MLTALDVRTALATPEADTPAVPPEFLNAGTRHAA